jgi:NAD/NADP transhydrogenase beta subunit
MPQMVALLNGFGGGASLLVAIAEFLHAREQGVKVWADGRLVDVMPTPTSPLR